MPAEAATSPRTAEASRPAGRELPAYWVVAPLLWGWTAVRLWHLATHRSDLDFAIFYDTGRAFWAGTDLYRSSRFGPAAPLLNLNPPIAVVLFAPLARLSEPIALVVWMAANTGAFAAALVIVYKELYSRPQPIGVWLRWLLWATLLMPVLHMLLTANLAWLLMLPATLAWRAARRGEDGAAGAWLGLCLMLKPLFLWFLLYWVLRKRWRTVWTAIAVGVVSLAAGWLLFGESAYRSWMETGRAVHWIADSANASVLCALTLALPRGAVGAAWIAAAAIVVVRSAWSLVRRCDVDRDWATVWLASILISPLGWIYYYNLAAAPLLAVLKRHRSHAATIALAGLCIQEVPLMWMLAGHPAAVSAVASIPFACTALLWWTLTSPEEGQGFGKQAGA